MTTVRALSNQRKAKQPSAGVHPREAVVLEKPDRFVIRLFGDRKWIEYPCGPHARICLTFVRRLRAERPDLRIVPYAVRELPDGVGIAFASDTYLASRSQQ